MYQIELRKPLESVRSKPEWRFRDIFVNGKFYGFFVDKSCGPRGRLYELRRADGSDAMKDPPADWKRRDKQAMLLWPQKHYQRNLKNGEPCLTRDERMIDLVKEAISIGELKDIDELNAENAEQSKRYEAEEKQRAYEKEKAFEARAAIALEPYIEVL